MQLIGMIARKANGSLPLLYDRSAAMGKRPECKETGRQIL
jgi:hypothetical protein